MIRKDPFWTLMKQLWGKVPQSFILFIVLSQDLLGGQGCVHMHALTFVSEWVYMCKHVHTCTWAYGSQRTTLNIIPQVCFTLC